MEPKTRQERVVFSEDGSRLAVCSLDGEVKIWDSATGTLTTHFSPEGARGVAVAAASWSRCIRKRRKSGKKLALAVGSKVIVWNDVKGRQECVLSGVHTKPVTGVAWGPTNTCVYSASDDRHVAVWDTGTWECTHKWQADKHGVKCICCHGDRDFVATAGRTIKLWKSSDYSLVKRLSGHATSIHNLLFIGDSLLLSCAHDDRVINLWSVEYRGSAAVASFTCEEEVTSCYVTVSMGTVHAVALTLEGVMHMFKYPLTNQIAAPISAHSTVLFTTGSSQQDTPSPLPVLAVCLNDDGVIVARSSALRPRIETLRWSECEGGRVCLVREEIGGLLLPGQGEKTPSKSKRQSVTVLGPGHMTMPDDKPTNQLADETPLSSRLQSVASAVGEDKSRAANAVTLSRLLAQAVQSGDRTLLEEPLRVRKDVIIRQTIRRLPVTLVVPLLKQLIKLLETSPGRGLELSLWVRHLLTQHSSYLMTQPQLVSTLSSFYQVLEVRSSVYSKLCRIHGKLDLMNIHESDGLEPEVMYEPLISLTVGDEVRGSEESGCESNDELSTDQSDVDSDVAMDTAEHKQQEFT